MAITWLRSASHLQYTQDGTIAIDGKEVFATFSTYETKAHDEPLFETHNEYIDIQLVLKGEEIIQVRSKEGLSVATEYDYDIAFWQVPSDKSYHNILMQKDTALILFPEDAHRPCLSTTQSPQTCFKLVVKVRV